MADDTDDTGQTDCGVEGDEFAVGNVVDRVTEQREDTSIVVQHPVTEEVPDEADVDAEYVQTMGLSVTPPQGGDVVVVQNTSADTQFTDRFVAFDVALIDDLIEALVEAKVRHGGEAPNAVKESCRQEVERIVQETVREASRDVRGRGRE